MEQILSSTPFGGRSLTPAMRRAEATLKSASGEPVAHKWRLWRAIAEGKEKIGVSDRALTVLNALLSFHPETTLTTTSQLIVFPSNEELSIRAHGMAPATLRRHLAALVDLGLIIRRDSPNGKRYARKNRDGEIQQAFGFDLSILVTRAMEFEAHAEEVKHIREYCAALRERISILKRDATKWIEVVSEGQGSLIDEGLHSRFAAIAGGLPRKAGQSILEGRARDLEQFLSDVQNLAKEVTPFHIMSANDAHSERHLIQNSNTHSPESELANRSIEAAATDTLSPPSPQTVKSYPLSMVLKACADVAMYARDGITTWNELVATADVARSALGISPDAWRAARETMGDRDAAIVVSSLLQRAERVRSPGGYLRALTGMARDGRFSVGPLLMALLNESLVRSGEVASSRHSPPTSAEKLGVTRVGLSRMGGRPKR